MGISLWVFLTGDLVAAGRRTNGGAPVDALTEDPERRHSPAALDGDRSVSGQLPTLLRVLGPEKGRFRGVDGSLGDNADSLRSSMPDGRAITNARQRKWTPW